MGSGGATLGEGKVGGLDEDVDGFVAVGVDAFRGRLR